MRQKAQRAAYAKASPFVARRSEPLRPPASCVTLFGRNMPWALVWAVTVFVWAVTVFMWAVPVPVWAVFVAVVMSAVRVGTGATAAAACTLSGRTTAFNSVAPRVPITPKSWVHLIFS